MDRNDELLLKLGWVRKLYRDPPDIGNPATHYWWRSPKLVAYDWDDERPRPYDNLQDSVDCVPEGWEWMAGTKKRDGKMYGFAYLYRAGQSVQPIIKVRDCPTPAEALSEAIMKAVEAGK